MNLALALALVFQTPPPAATVAGEPLAARDEARACLSVETPRERALAACRRALELGLRGERAAAIRVVLAQKLADRLEWDAAAAVYRELVRDEPRDALAWRRLGEVLLHGVGRPEQAVEALREAVRLAPADADMACALGVALNASGEHAEAVERLEAAERLDASIFERRPAAQKVLEASRRGERWPYQPSQNGPSPKSQSR